MDFFKYPVSPELDSVLLKLGIENHFYAHKNQYFFTSCTWEMVRELSSKYPDLNSLKNLAHQAVRQEIDSAQEDQLQSRIQFSIESYLQDPPCLDCLDEIFLLLHLNPQYSYQYAGRGISPAKEIKTSKTHQVGDYFYIDSIGGRREYCWRVASSESTGNRAEQDQEFAGLKKWLSEPDCRIVLSLGGGGFRLFAIPTLLKVIDLLKKRKSIREIWGCSGGAIAGGLYAHGVSPQVIEQIGYDFYQKKYPEFEVGNAITNAILSIAKKRLKNLQVNGLLEVVDLFKEIGKKALAKRNLLAKEIPFFAIGSNLNQKSPVVLTEEKNLPNYEDESMRGMDLISVFTATSAIPILFEPYIHQVNALEKEVICDGVLSEDVPLIQPYNKWRKDLKFHPEKTEKKLKILYLDLGLRFSESKWMRYFDLPFSPLRPLAHLGRIVDTFIQGRVEQSLELLKSLPNVEAEGVRLEINRIALLSPFQVPRIIQEGRKDLLKKLRSLSQKLEKREDLASSDGTQKSQLTSADKSG